MVSPDAYGTSYKSAVTWREVKPNLWFFLFFTGATATVVIGKDLQVAGCLNNFWDKDINHKGGGVYSTAQPGALGV